MGDNLKKWKNSFDMIFFPWFIFVYWFTLTWAHEWDEKNMIIISMLSVPWYLRHQTIQPNFFSEREIPSLVGCPKSILGINGGTSFHKIHGDKELTKKKMNQTIWVLKRYFLLTWIFIGKQTNIFFCFSIETNVRKTKWKTWTVQLYSAELQRLK